MKHHRYVALLGALVGLAACGGDEEPVTPPPSLRVATYNAGLAVGFVTAAKERAPLTSQAIAGLGANLVCVQEYWRKDHVAALQQATAASLPQTFFPDPMPDDNPGEAACTHEELAELDACVKAKCDVCVDELVKCVLKNCGAEFSAVPEGCSGCLQANVGQELDDIVQSCTSGSVAYAYGGAFGTGILTGATIKAKDQTVFASHTNRRAVLHVELETAPLGTVHAFCTHLTA
ncbi:MAG: hypothetical protein HY744_23645, partial [Deltaproteobacteria bacterium]|nr:hypothetical protein [Deltaproteobacteria bacterium]